MKDTQSISLSVKTEVEKTLKLKKVIHNYSRPILTTTTQTTYCLGGRDYCKQMCIYYTCMCYSRIALYIN